MSVEQVPAPIIASPLEDDNGNAVAYTRMVLFSGTCPLFYFSIWHLTTVICRTVPKLGRQWGSDMRLRPPRQWLRFQHAGTPHLATTIGASVISQANPVGASIFGAGFSS
jgi:hypothetical protein